MHCVRHFIAGLVKVLYHNKGCCRLTTFVMHEYIHGLFAQDEERKVRQESGTMAMYGGGSSVQMNIGP